MIDDLLAGVRDEQNAQLAADASARDEIESRLAARMPRPRPARSPWPIAAVAALALVSIGGGLAWWGARGEPAITYSVEGGIESVGGFVAAREPATLAFSEGSRVSLGAGAAARVVATDGHGAAIALEQGALSASVVHRDGTSWRVYAGPFAVMVTGTRFGVQWSEARAELEVEVEEGSVRVEGACLAAPRAVRAGERAVLGCEGWREDPVALAPVEPAATVAERAATRTSPPAPTATSDGSTPRIRELRPRATPEPVASGTEAVPAPSAASRLDEAQRAALAGDVAGARTTLLAVREQAGDTGDGSMAAFLLGRLAFDAQRDYAEAERWFAAYESERPEGALIREAMGRRLEALARSEDAEGARAQAARYLARFPTGPHAARALEILDP